MEDGILEQLKTEEEHSAFLEKLLRTLYGDGWEKLTLSKARAWHIQHFASQQAVQADAKKCGFCGSAEIETKCQDCGANYFQDRTA